MRLSTSLARRRTYAGLPMIAFAIIALVSFLLPASPALAAPILKLSVELAPGTPNPIDTGQTFRYRLTYECSSSLAGDECVNMRIVSDPLPANLQGVQVLGNGDVTLADFNTSTRQATWEFRSPLPPGTTGQLEFEVRFVPGTTVDGEPGGISAVISADGLTPVSASPSVVPVSNARDNSTVSKTLESGGALDDRATYRINVCTGGNGSLELGNVVITDTLPLGATYLSSTPPATTVDTGAVPPVLVWSGISGIAAGSCGTYRVVVSYPASDASNTLGASKTNDVEVSGTPYGASLKVMTDDVTHALASPSPGISLDKSATADTVEGGQIVTNLQIENTGNVTLQNVQIVDPIPPEHDLQQIDTGASVAVAYQRNGDPTWIPGVVLGNGVAVNDTNFPNLLPGDYVSALRFTIGTVQKPYTGSPIILRSTAINPPHGQPAYTLTPTQPRLVTNTATVSAEFNGAPLTDQQDGATTEIAVPKARPIPQKTIVSGSPAIPGDIVRYRLTMGNGSFRALDEPVFADLLPAALAYVPGSQAVEQQIAGCATAPTFQSIDDYNGSGRTLLLWSWAGTGCSIPSGGQARVTFDVQVKLGTYPTSALPNRSALVNYSTDPNLVRTQYCASPAPAEAAIFTSGGGVDTSKLCFSPTSDLRINSVASISSAKLVRGQLDPQFHRDPKVGATVQGGLITYSMALTNTGNVDFRTLQIIDILPYNLPLPGNLGVRDLLPLGTAWTPQLAGAVTITPAIPGLTVRYSTETNPCRPELTDSNPGCTPMVDGDDPAPGVWSLNLPTDPTAVRSLKFDFGSYILTANEAVQFTFPMFAPIDAPIATAGPDAILGNSDDTDVAWNTFAYSAIRDDDGTQLVAQPPRVGIEVQPIPPDRASFGDYVWNDVDQEGDQDEPEYRGINGVSVRLYRDDDGNAATTGDQTLLGTTITRNDSGGNPGFYLFPALEPGNYFAEIVPPPGYTVTVQDAAGGDDTEDSDADPVTRRTPIVTLVGGQDHRDTDMGVYAPVISIGNRVWFDTDNNGLDDDGDGTPGSATGISGVTVELFQDVNGDGGLTGAEQQPIAIQTTDASGFYRFDAQTYVGGVALGAGNETPLYPGSYVVGIPASNFAPGGPLNGYHSSGTTISGAGVIADAAAPDPDTGVLPNPGVDRDENGDKQLPSAAFYPDGVLSKALSVTANEPLAEPEPAGTAPEGTPIEDFRSNLTVDFGFYTQSVGDIVWVDDGAGGGTFNNGVRDGAEQPLASATVQLFTTGGDEIAVGPDGRLGTADDAAGGVTTAADGLYRFRGLPAGSYTLRVTPPAGFASSRDVAGQTTSPNGNHDDDDNGIASDNGAADSAAFALTPGSLGALSENTVSDADGSTLNPTLDFGFVRSYSLGNRVWADANNSGTLDGGETGVSGVTLRLYLADGTTRATTVGGATVADATTNASGYYRFDNLPAGDYTVEVMSSNFAGTLNGLVSSTGAGQQADPDTDIDSDDNGLDALVSGAVQSGVITLGEGDGADEPTGDGDGGAHATAESPNDQSNRTLDFGFFEPLSLGNRVWDDLNNDGRLNGAEAGVAGVAVNLYRDTNNDNQPDDLNSDTQIDAADQLATMVTNATGHYLFTMLQPDTYLVEIVPPAGYRGSTGNGNAYEPGPDPDTVATDSDDNGTAAALTIRSRGITLARGVEPTGEAATTGLVDNAADRNSNATLDFGIFRPLTLGNLVWNDADNSGTVNGAKAGISGVTVRLYRDSNNDGNRDDLDGGGIGAGDIIQSATTSATGHYLFTGLGVDTYIVEVVTPAGYTSSTGLTPAMPYQPAPDADTNATDDDDNGGTDTTVTPGAVVRSRPVTLSLGGEPTGEPATPGLADDAEDNNSNLTVDFGFYEALSLGNRVWLDANNSGTLDGGESGINNVSVRLYRDSDDNGTPDDLNGGGVTTADAIRTATTNSSGHYLFVGLNADTYIVEIVPPGGHRTSTGPGNAYEPAPDPDLSVIDLDDNGTLSGAVVRSGPVTLSLGAEPTGEASTTGITDTTADNRSNLTVDFGLFRPVSLGNLVFQDVDNSGTYVGGTDTPLAGATVSLFLGDGTTPATDADGNPVASQVTAADGLYSFTNLLPGNYVVTVVAPAGYRGSTGAANAYEPGPDADTTVTDNDDNGTGTGNSAASQPITLTTNGEPDTAVDGDNTDGNRTLDFGFWQPVSLGNLVFLDRDGNSSYTGAADTPLAGVTVSLLLSDGTTPATDVNGDPVASQVTAADGLYAFTNLPPGQYRVRVQAPAGHTSTADLGSTANPNNDTNHDDNGVGQGNTALSPAITLTSGGEPGLVADGDDVNGNTTLDFGFWTPVSLGNLVFEDRENSGLFDGTDAPLAGATASLLLSDGTTQARDVTGMLVPNQVTGADGLYAFTNLPPGQYRVRVQAPAGYRSSSDAASAAPDTDTDDDDSGVGSNQTATSAAITLTIAGEPDVAADGDGTSGNTTLDFGFFQLLSLGNLIFEDANNDGAYAPGNDTPLAGAIVSLYRGDGTTPATDAAGTSVASQTTGANGLYSFTNLAPGDYVVRVTAPSGYRGSTGVANAYEPGPDPDTTVTDNDDNGTGTGNVVNSAPVTLSSGEEPTTPADEDGANGNTTLDFGFWRPLSLGNLVFEDGDNDGENDSAADVPLAGATVELFLGDGTTPATDVDGIPVASQTTAADGLYTFTNLRPGSYVVGVTAPAGYRSSSDIATTGTPDGNANNDDNGVGATQTVNSQSITLTSGGEPDTAADGDGVNGNTTLDFGFWRPLSLGDLVFEDRDGNSSYTVADDEPLAGATVELFLSDGTTPATDADGSLVASQTTAAEGLYAFTNLPPGDYVVRVTAPTGYTSSAESVAADPNGNLNDDDNGVGRGNTVSSQPITLTSGGEPGLVADGDDTSGNTTLDFGFVLPVSLGNLVFEDRDDNGLFDGTDTPLAGATVSLFLGDGTTPAVDVDGSPVASQTTGADGLYAFDNLPPGDYVVTVGAPAGYRSSTDGAPPADPDGDIDSDDNGLGAGQTVSSAAITLTIAGEPNTPADEDGTSGNTTLDFGFFQPLSLGNLVFEDADNSGDYAPGTDTPLAGATVSLFLGDGTTQATDVNGNPVASQVTGADGLYAFTNLTPGDYVVRVTAPAGYRGSTGVANAYEPGPDADVDASDDDDNGTGIGNTASSAPITLTSGGEPDTAADGDGVNGNQTLDFGFFQPLSLGNLVFEDRDGNSSYTGADDAPLAGATVELFLGDGTTPATDADGSPVASQVTDADGLYAFTNLLPGNYVVRVTAPAGYTSARDIGTSLLPNGNVDHDDNGEGLGATATSQPITLTSRGEPNTPADEDGASGNTTLDFGFWTPLSLGNLVFEDGDNSGAYAPGADRPLAGATVELFLGDGTTQATDVNGNPVASQVTGADGLYSFTNLTPGDYVVRVTAPAGYRGSTGVANAYEPGPDADVDASDDDDNGTGTGNTASSAAITLTSGGEPGIAGDGDGVNGNQTLDFGFWAPLSLGNLVFEDADNDGTYEGGTDSPLAGATVSLFLSDGTTPASDADGSPVASQVTGADGLYAFTNLLPGEYRVSVTAPAGYRSSTDVPSTITPAGDENGDDNGEGSLQTAASRAIPLTSGGEPDSAADGDGVNGNTTLDFGFFRPLRLGNLVWEDRDDDGTYESATETPLAGATVSLFLDDGTTAATDADGSPVANQVTGTDGLYLFTNLLPGDYVVTVAAPADYRSSTDGAATGDPNGDLNDDDNGEGMLQTASSQPITLRSSGEPSGTDGDDADGNLTLDFGFLRPAAIGNRVWLDTDADGVQDAGETGLPGVTVSLYRPGPDGIAGTGDDLLVDTTITGGSGDYRFDDLPAGEYFLLFDATSGYLRSPLGGTADGDADSDADVTTGRTSITTLDPGEEDGTWDAGYFYSAGLGDRVWLDRNASGVQDAGEPGVPGVTVELLDALGNTVDTTTTDADGFYIFTNLPPGDYQVRFILPAGYLFSPTGQGSATSDSDADPLDGTTPVTSIVLTEYDPSWDAGLYRLVSLGDLVWDDLDNDGRFDASESGVANVVVELYHDANGNGQAESGELAGTQQTGPSGEYLFAELVPGTYIVVLPQGNFAAGSPLAGYASSTGRYGPATGPYEPAGDPDDDTDGDDSGSASAGGVAAAPVTLTTGEEPDDDGDTDTDTNRSVDFGVFRPASLGSIVWYDTDEDGMRDAGELGVSGITVTLYDAGGAVVATTTTNTSGWYAFLNLPPGSYTIGFSNLSGYVFTDRDQGADDGIDSDVDTATGRTGTVSLVPGENNLTIYAGIYQDPSTAITLTSFTATWQGGAVVVRWTTSAEIDTWGFHLYRSATGRRADAERVTPELILGRGRGQAGASYSWTDGGVTPGGTYSYWLEETELGGARNEYGPVSTAPTPEQARYQLALPMVGR
jgi:protocatechuate 3,4-dioxygenase beta subunit